MIEGFPVALLNGVGVVGLVILMGWMQATGRLVTRREHQETVDQVAKIEKERDEWRDMALRSLGVTERMTAPVEAVADVMTRLPDPASQREGDPS